MPQTPRRFVVLLIVLFLAACASNGPRIAALDQYPPQVTGRTDVLWYDVHGATAAELSADMHKLGPKNADGSWVGETRTPIRWTYRTRVDGAACSISDVRVFVNSQITLPRWTPPADTEPGLAAEWNRFLSALETHENGHKDISARAASEIVSRLENLSGGCRSLGADVTNRTNGILDRERFEQVQYDANTRHGLTQGTVLRSQLMIAAGAPAALPASGRGPALSGNAMLGAVAARTARLGVKPETLTVRVGATFSLLSFQVTAYDSSGRALMRVPPDMRLSSCPSRLTTPPTYEATGPGSCEIVVRFPARYWTRSDSMVTRAIVQIVP